MPIEYIPPRDSISIEDLGDSLRFVIPNRIDPGYLVYLSLFLLPSGLFFLLGFFSGIDGSIRCLASLLLLVFGFLVVILDLFNFSQILRSLSGCEVLVVTGEALYLSRGAGRRVSEYLFIRIQGLKPHPNFRTGYLPVQKQLVGIIHPFDIEIKVKNATGGGLSFLYDNVEIRFANGADAHEGRRILNAIQEKFPHYKAVISSTIGYTE